MTDATELEKLAEAWVEAERRHSYSVGAWLRPIEIEARHRKRDTARAAFTAAAAKVGEREAELRAALEAHEDMHQRGLFFMTVSEIDRVHDLRRRALASQGAER